ncbi:hypothetical protein B0J15DRAFT_95794 [Fusarium solani]|uniref:Secreted protein n=1 Tax=Fusarium solani TaxID=169388 RepID=A0A9P9GQ18_FUSSL|nr:uncharacterized protein B0J15DRAFT_95794 [Fusarium solani]KAH7243211.1 hypothetical protein B0J15DRAFT_95794 [Fusarium solani]
MGPVARRAISLQFLLVFPHLLECIEHGRKCCLKAPSLLRRLASISQPPIKADRPAVGMALPSIEPLDRPLSKSPLLSVALEL